MSAVVVLPMVWGFAEVSAKSLPGQRKGPARLVLAGVPSLGAAVVGLRSLVPFDRTEGPAAELEALQSEPLTGDLAFYRKYTEGMLRRYMKMKMEGGRAPSLLGREMFRGNVTSYQVRCFDDVVIFVHDVGRCLARLDSGQQHLIRRIALQEFTQAETASILGLSLRTTQRKYRRAIDCLTALFLERNLLERNPFDLELLERDPIDADEAETENPAAAQCCQGGKCDGEEVSSSI